MTRADPLIAFMLASIYWPEFPVPVGVVRNISRPTHDQMLTTRSPRPRPPAARATCAASLPCRRDLDRRVAHDPGGTARP